jgi:broad specificity phosphatase PhoE
MSRLFFVRHAQASFLAENYDKLSPLGEKQATLLGEYWARHKMIFARVCIGPRVRHADTCRIVAEAYQRAGLIFPAPTQVAEFDEYAGEAVLKQGVPHLIEHESEIRDLYHAYETCSEPGDKNLAFQRLFEAVITIWVNGELPLAGVEPWGDFCARVEHGLTSFLGAGATSTSEQVAIFASAGPTAVAVEQALGLGAIKTAQLSWMVRNCSYSEFVYGGDKFALSTFNTLPHLDDETMRTYR